MKTFKRTLALVLVLAMALSVVVFPAAAATEEVPVTSFTDVKETDWFYNSVMRWTKAGVINGKANNGDGTGVFDPNGTMKRGEFAKVMAEALGLTKEAENKFTDVTNHWAKSYILRCYEAGIINGYTDANGKLVYKPEDTITREQAFAMMCRAMSLSKTDTTKVDTFEDSDEITDWAAEEGVVATMVNYGAVIGDDNGELNPTSEIKRSEVLKILDRLVGVHVSKDGVITTSTEDTEEAYEYGASNCGVVVINACVEAVVNVSATTDEEGNTVAVVSVTDTEGNTKTVEMTPTPVKDEKGNVVPAEITLVVSNLTNGKEEEEEEKGNVVLTPDDKPVEVDGTKEDGEIEIDNPNETTEPACEHKNVEYEYIYTSHKIVCKDCKETVKEAVACTDGDDEDHKCDLCGGCAQHAGYNVDQGDGTHAFVCLYCDATDDAEEHEKTEDGRCKYCNYCEHRNGLTYEKVDEETHDVWCSVCGLVEEAQDCTFEGDVCKFCGNGKSTEPDESTETACEHKDDNEDHECDLCGGCTQHYGIHIDQGNDTHAFVCKYCGAVDDVGPHVDEDENGVCDYCRKGEHTHEYTTVVTAPTCEDQGFTTYTCACTDSYNSDYIDPLGHNWQQTNGCENCAVDYTPSYECANNCGQPNEGKPVDAHSHTFVGGKCTCCGMTEADAMKFNLRVSSNDNYVDMNVTNDYVAKITVTPGQVSASNVTLSAKMQNVDSLGVSGIREHTLNITTDMSGDPELKVWLSNAFDFNKGKLNGAKLDVTIHANSETYDTDYDLTGTVEDGSAVIRGVPVDVEYTREAWGVLASNVTTNTQTEDDSSITIANGSSLQVLDEVLRFEDGITDNLKLDNFNNFSAMEGNIRSKVKVVETGENTESVIAYLAKDTQLAVGQSVATLNEDCKIVITGIDSKTPGLDGILSTLRDATSTYSMAESLVNLVNALIGSVDAGDIVYIDFYFGDDIPTESTLAE